MYAFLDIFFLVFHTALIGFNMTGWIWKKTRRIHLLTISLTLLSWIGLGVFYGFGYCPCTDWHWQVKRALGETDLPASYVKYYLDALTGMDWDPSIVDPAVGVIGIAAFLVSVWLNGQDRRRALRVKRAD